MSDEHEGEDESERASIADDIFTRAGEGATDPGPEPDATDSPAPADQPDPTGWSGINPNYPDAPPDGFVPGPIIGQPDPYPAGPPQPASHEPDLYPAGAAQFGRRPPQHGPRPDANGYYPGDYYVGPDWMRIIVGGLAAVTVFIAAAAGGLWLWEEFAPTDEDDEIAQATPTPLPLVLVYECAGDPEPVAEMLAPAPTLIVGRTADSRWLAFRNPQAPPLQLWVRSTAVPEFAAFDVGVVSCADSPDTFPTPAARPTPVPTIAAESDAEGVDAGDTDDTDADTAPEG